MSFIQKLIERKTQATGSLASRHAVEEDLIAQEADLGHHEDEITMVDIIDLDDPDAPPQNEGQSAPSLPEPSNNVLNLTDPFAIGEDDDEITGDITDLPDLEAEFAEEAEAVAEISEEAEQGLEPPTSLGDIGDDDSEDIDAEDETFNIWDVEMGGDAEADSGEPDSPAPEQIQAANTPTPEPRMPQIRSVEPVNEDLKPSMPLRAPEPTPEITPEAAQDSAEPQPQEPETPISVAAAAPIASASTPAQPAPAAAPQQAEVPAQTPGKRRIGRVKTRLLGFEHASKPGINLFDRSAVTESAAESATDTPTEPTVEKVAQPRFPVGWFVVIKGPGRGETFALQAGMSQIGRGEDQVVQLDFGDETISRDNHAAIVYDVETHTFLMGHGGKANVVRLNGKPLICTEEVKNSDLIRIGETTLRLVAFCDAEFNWEDQDSKGPDDVATA
jgi:hypothetical protein